MIKIRTLLYALMLTLAVTGGAVSAHAQQWDQKPSATTSSDFFSRAKDGWFFYEPFPVEQEDVEESPMPAPPPPKAEPPQQVAVAPPPPPPGPLAMSSKWIKENMPEYLHRAIDEPSAENVRAFMTVQRVMMDKASAFSEAVQRVTMGDPLLDETVRRPVAPFASTEMNRVSTAAKQSELGDLSKQAAIWFFYRSDCNFCHQMIPILKNMERLYGFYIMSISLDGLPLSEDFPEWRTDSGQAAQLQVLQTPAIFLVKPPDMFVPLTQGAVTQDDLEQRIILGATKAGWISEETFERTRNQNAGVPSFASVPLDGFEENGDPNAIVEFLRSRVKER